MKQKALTFLLLFVLSQHVFSQCYTQIAAGSDHTVAIQSDGTLWAWGLNDFGQLGDGTTINKSVPTQIGTNTDWAFIDASGYNTMALKTDGSLWSWGSNNFGQIGNGNGGIGIYNTTPTLIGTDTDWVKFTAFSFAIKSNGTLWAWGYNMEGQLGTGDFINHYRYQLFRC
jgi:alpha-tubulin suppressor-like RCC1 family protein